MPWLASRSAQDQAPDRGAARRFRLCNRRRERSDRRPASETELERRLQLSAGSRPVLPQVQETGLGFLRAFQSLLASKGTTVVGFLFHHCAPGTMVCAERNAIPKTLVKVLKFNRCIFIVHHGRRRKGEPGTRLFVTDGRGYGIARAPEDGIAAAMTASTPTCGSLMERWPTLQNLRHGSVPVVLQNALTPIGNPARLIPGRASLVAPL
jgi:hypothetical protein